MKICKRPEDSDRPHCKEAESPPGGCELRCKRLGVQWSSGRLPSQFVPGQQPAVGEDSVDHESADSRVPHVNGSRWIGYPGANLGYIDHPDFTLGRPVCRELTEDGNLP